MAAGALAAAWKYGEAQRALVERSAQFETELQGFDAVLTPTSPIFPPRLSDLRDEERYLALNKKSFAFTELANRLGKPSISLPLGSVSSKPTALLLTGTAGHRSEERRVGKESVSTCRARWSPDH